MEKLLSTGKVYDGDWLSIVKIRYLDKNGKERTWESCSRSKCEGAVAVIAILRPSRRIILVRQFRPPAGAFVIEFPAGLVSPGEAAEHTAVRELEEETGYKGRLMKMTDAFFSSPGLSGEKVSFAFVEIDEGAEGVLGTPSFDDGEHIDTFLVPLCGMPDFIAERSRMGDRIDAKVAAAAMLAGLEQ